jgi:hypothetical protein
MPLLAQNKSQKMSSIHIELLTMGTSMWTLFFIAGLPSNYFQSLTFLYQFFFVVFIPTIILAFIIINKIRILSRYQAISRTVWTAFYFTVPFLILDIIYLGIHKNLGVTFFISHWYLTAFYITPWLIVPLLLLIHSRLGSQTADLSNKLSKT